MADITLTIPNAVLTRVLDAFAKEYGYDAAKDGTRAQFAKVVLVNFIKRTVKESEVSDAIKTSSSTIDSDINTNIVIS